MSAPAKTLLSVAATVLDDDDEASVVVVGSGVLDEAVGGVGRTTADGAPPVEAPSSVAEGESVLEGPAVDSVCDEGTSICVTADEVAVSGTEDDVESGEGSMLLAIRDCNHDGVEEGD